jgi:hypothetical protein
MTPLCDAVRLVGKYQRFAGTFCLYLTGYFFLSEDGGSTFTRNIDTYLQNYLLFPSSASVFYFDDMCQ